MELVHFASGVSVRRLVGVLWTPRFAQIFAYGILYTARPIWTKDGSKRIIPRKDLAFGGLNDIPINFGILNFLIFFFSPPVMT